MRYQTDPITQIEEKWLKSRKVSVLGIFWCLIMLIMQNWDFSGTWGLLQMLLPILYLHNMRYRTDPMSQSLENGPKLRFWANFDIIMLIMRERDFSRACGFLQMLINTLYLLNMRYGTDPMTQFWAKCEKPRFWANFDIIMLIMRKQDFFSKIGLRHFSPLTSEQLHAKNLRDPMVGSMRTFVTDRQTDRRRVF